jgi:hypothetical protein
VCVLCACTTTWSCSYADWEKVSYVDWEDLVVLVCGLGGGLSVFFKLGLCVCAQETFCISYISYDSQYEGGCVRSLLIGSCVA